MAIREKILRSHSTTRFTCRFSTAEEERGMNCNKRNKVSLPLVLVLVLDIALSLPAKISVLRYVAFMAQSSGKKLIKIDASIDTVCPWCFMGHKNMEKAINSSRDQYDFEIRWHSFFLNPSAPKVGVVKNEYYGNRFGRAQWKQMAARMGQLFRTHGLEYDTEGLTGNTLDSHRIIQLAGTQGRDKQNALVEEILVNYNVRGKYIGDRQMLIEAAEKAGVVGAAEMFEDENRGVKEVYEDIQKYSTNISGVPHFVINGIEVHGAQPPEVFLRAFQAAR
ncbi:hypothetical protein H6P81_019342 [Aristolochia fimbriata]|uniref:DSBA-like thioredoxin domain-containing protein n=1 Tax=Aristolochia fimbriata TaxID=158543 RepID=A0AAV7DRL3_ARIFI|nr:hypothetical protein H6P81_019342 [Aristolochia fimbriata]